MKVDFRFLQWAMTVQKLVVPGGLAARERVQALAEKVS